MLKNFKKYKKHRAKPLLFSNFSTHCRWLILALFLGLVTGCGDLFEPTIKTICEDYPHFCADLNQDGWCRAEKSNIIRHRYDHQNDDSERPKYDLLIHLEDYDACISKASQIQHKKYREREFGRKGAAVTANKALRQLVWQTRHSADPYVSYYQWSRFGHEDAKERFVRAAQAGVFSEPKYYVDLASIQVATDPIAARNALFMALSHYANVDSEIDGSISSQLATLSLEMENYRMAYVWTKVTNHFADNIDDSQLVALATQFSLPVDILDQLSGDIIDAISGRDFDAHAMKIDQL